MYMCMYFVYTDSVILCMVNRRTIRCGSAHNFVHVHVLSCVCMYFYIHFFIPCTRHTVCFRTCNSRSRCSTRKWRRQRGVRSSSTLTKSLQSTPSFPSLLPVLSLQQTFHRTPPESFPLECTPSCNRAPLIPV